MNLKSTAQSVFILLSERDTWLLLSRCVLLGEFVGGLFNRITRKGMGPLQG